MARLVVLRFEDDNMAEDFLRPSIMRKYGEKSEYSYTVEMMVQTPTQFCSCAYRGDGWRRGDKRGWWIHASCGKPSVGWGENPRAVISEAKDLLEKESANTEERLQEIAHDG